VAVTANTTSFSIHAISNTNNIRIKVTNPQSSTTNMGLLNLLRGKKKPKVEIIKATDNDISDPGHENSSSHRKHPNQNVEHVRKSAREREGGG